MEALVGKQIMYSLFFNIAFSLNIPLIPTTVHSLYNQFIRLQSSGPYVPAFIKINLGSLEGILLDSNKAASGLSWRQGRFKVGVVGNRVKTNESLGWWVRVKDKSVNHS